MFLTHMLDTFLMNIVHYDTYMVHICHKMSTLTLEIKIKLSEVN